MSILMRMRDDLRDFTLYTPGDGDGALIRLHANESPFRADGDNSARGLNRYPLGRDPRLQARLADLYNVAPANVMVTRGSDDGIDLLLRTFCQAGRDNIVCTRPGFGMYSALARLQGCATHYVDIVAESAFALDLHAVIDAANRDTKLVFLCSPNNPSGLSIPLDDIARACTALRNQALVVVDEAYAEFSDAASTTTLLARFDNLVVLRTLSKAYGLASARVGAVLGDAAIVKVLDRLLTPFPLPTASVEAALAHTRPSNVDTLQVLWRTLVNERRRMAVALAELKHTTAVFPSDANFLLTRMHEPAAVVARCKTQGLLVRLIRGVDDHYVRITIGTAQENDRLLTVLKESD